MYMSRNLFVFRDDDIKKKKRKRHLRMSSLQRFIEEIKKRTFGKNKVEEHVKLEIKRCGRG